MKRSTLEQVQEFHETYGLPVESSPNISDQKTNDLRINLIAEELEELKEALKNNDIVETLDALIDLQYVLDGAFLSFGLHDVKETAFAEVHRSNMSKLGEDGKPSVPSKYFLGLPSPGAAGILVSLVVANHAVGGAFGAGEYASFILAITVTLAGLMVSNVEFRTFKDVRLNLHSAAFVGFAVLSSAFISTQLKPAFVLVWLLGFYVLLGLCESLWRLPTKLRAKAEAARVEDAQLSSATSLQAIQQGESQP